MSVGSIGSKSLTAVKDLIPKSRLVAIGDFFVSDPLVSEGDDVYEINLTDYDLKTRNFHQMEPWMLPDTEIMFLKYIASNDSNNLEKFIEFANKNYWLGRKCILLNLDKGKTIENRQTKLVLYNSNPKSTLNHKIPHSLKKTNFILEEWPYSSVNQLILPNDNDIAPWMRSKNRKLKALHSISNNTNTSATKPVASTAAKNQQKHQQQQQQQQQRNNKFFFVPCQPMFVYGQLVPMVSFLPNFACYGWSVDFHQWLPMMYVTRPPPTLAPTHLRWNAQRPTRTNSSSTTTAAAVGR